MTVKDNKPMQVREGKIDERRNDKKTRWKRLRAERVSNLTSPSPTHLRAKRRERKKEKKRKRNEREKK